MGKIVNIPLDEYLDKSQEFKNTHRLWRTAVEFPWQTSPLPLPPYIMGSWLGDGTSRLPEITTGDMEVAQEWSSYACMVGLRSMATSNSEGSIRLSLRNHRSGGVKKNPLTMALREAGVLQNKHIPHVYKTASTPARLELLAGIIDTDGAYIKCCYTVHQKSECLAQDIAFVARSVGLAVTVTLVKKRCTNNGVVGEYFAVNICGDTDRIPCRIARKKAERRVINKDHLVSKFKVEAIGCGSYYGFTLSGDHLYLLRDFTVTHNTLLAAHLISSALDKRRKPIFTCPAVSLIDQTVKAFEAEGIHDIGVMQAQHVRTDRHAATQVASVQTLVRRERPDVDFMLLDEIHMQFKALNDMLDTHWKDKIAIGLTATPWAKGMGLRWTKLIIPATIPQLIEEGFLTPTDMYIPSEVAVRGNIDVEKGQFTEASASKEMRQSRIVGNVVDTWQKLSSREKTFMFCVNREHAREQMGAFIDSGIPFGYIDANTNISDRHLQFEKMKYGDIAGIASVGCLIAGVDEDVRCIIDAQPDNSEMHLVQKWGRGIRTAPGKTCIARDSLVLTQHGLVKIQDITLDHMVWDGVNFVHHKGAICQGIKEVIEHDGITGTPDHEVMTNDGFQTLADAKRGQRRIVTTGIGGNPIWFSEDNFPTHGRWWIVSSSRGSWVRELWTNPLRTLLQHEEAPSHGGVSALQWEVSSCQNIYSEMAIRAMRGAEGKVPESAEHILPSLRGEGYKIPLRRTERSGAVDRGEPGDSEPIVRDRQNTEQWELRAWESAMGDTIKADEQYQNVRWDAKAKDSGFSEKLPTREVCRQHPEQIDELRSYRRGNTAPVEPPIKQTKREVWDILSAGPLQRFTVNGKLVHNCLIGLDHAGNNSADGLGLFWEIYHDHLDTHKESDKEVAYEGDPKPQKPQRCPTCHVLIPKGHAVCIKCGAPLSANSGIVHVDGDLALYGGEKKKVKERQYTMEEKQAWYSGLLWIVRERGGADGAAAHRYREKFGTWPNHLAKEPRPPSFEVERFDKHCRIKFIKGKQKGEANATQAG